MIQPVVRGGPPAVNLKKSRFFENPENAGGLSTTLAPRADPATKNEILHRMGDPFRHKKFWDESVNKLWKKTDNMKISTSKVSKKWAFDD